MGVAEAGTNLEIGAVIVTPPMATALLTCEFLKSPGATTVNTESAQSFDPGQHGIAAWSSPGRGDTGRRLAELEALYETAPIGLCLFDEHLRWIRVNRVIAEISGMSMEELIGKTPSEVAPGIGEQAEAALHAVLRTGERVQFDLHGTTPARPGRPGTWSVRCVPTRDAAGRIAGISVAVDEITERCAADDALRASEDRLRKLADAMPQVVWMARPDGRIDYFNQRHKELAGVRSLDDGTWSWSDALVAGDRDATLKAWATAVQNGTPYEIEHRLTRIDGSVHWYLTRGVPVRDDGGQIARWFGTATDIEGQKRAEEAVREADRQKSEFLALVSHELRNPISVMHTSLQLIDRAGIASEHGQRALPLFRRQVLQVNRLLEDLLDVARVSNGKVLLRREWEDLNDVVRCAGDDHRQTFEHEGVTFEVTTAAQPIRGFVDRARITQVVSNLLHNCAKFTPRGGHVVLSVGMAGRNAARIDVRDDGVGIAPEVLDRVFEPLVQDARTRYRSAGGLGLGLPLVKQLTELHGGTVTAASEGPGRGAVFTIRLPLE